MRIGQIGQIQIVVHPAMPVVIAALAASTNGMLMGVMLFTLVLHETAHALCARVMGIRVTQIELMPFGGAVRLEGFQALSGWRGAIIAAAGPLSNALMVMACATAVQYGLCAPQELREIVVCNLTLMIFNLLPVLPMDGGRILCAILSYIWGDSRCRRILSLLGCFMSLFLMAVGIWGAWKWGKINMTLFLMGSYLLYAALSERRVPGYRQMESIMGKEHRILREDILPLRHALAYQEIPVYKLASRLSATTMYQICVVDEQAKTIGIIEESDIIRAMLHNPMQPLRAVLEAREKA